MPSCFVIMPITTPSDLLERYGGDLDHFAHVLDHLFVPAIEKAGHEAIRPNAEGGDLIQAEIVKNLETADIVLCDISGLNPNVFFELGIRTALDRAVCIVRDDQTSHIPFDTGIINTHTYHSGLQPWRLDQEIEQLAAHLTATVERAEGRNSLWRYFGLTQRGSGSAAAVEDDPQGSALEVIMNELRQLRRERSAAPLAEEVTSAPGGDRAQRFLVAVRDIMGESGARWAIKEVGPNRVVFAMTGEARNGDSRSFLSGLGRAYGVDVSFRGGNEP